MAIYARIQNGTVAELFTPPAGIPIADCFHADLQWVECDGTSGVAPGWTYAAGVFSAPPAPPAPTLAQQAVNLLSGGIAITSTGTGSLSATYPADAPSQQKMLAVQAVLAATSAFPGGATTWPVKDMAGGWHVCTPAQFTAIAVALAAFVAPIDLIVDGHPGISLPATTATIA